MTANIFLMYSMNPALSLWSWGQISLGIPPTRFPRIIRWGVRKMVHLGALSSLPPAQAVAWAGGSLGNGQIRFC